jgi:hypothetical protein
VTLAAAPFLAADFLNVRLFSAYTMLCHDESPFWFLVESKTKAATLSRFRLGAAACPKGGAYLV